MKLNNNDLQALGELPHGWSVSTLGKILPLTYGKALKKEDRDESGTVPVYGSSGQVGIHSDALTNKPALIVGRKGSVGEVYRSPVPCWPIDTVYFSEERDGSDLKYFEYLLRGLKLSRLDKSTAVPGLSRDDYNAVEVAIAPLDQQKHIVAEIEKQFSRLDEAVANLNRVKANLKRYKSAVLKTAVEGRLVETEAEIARREGRNYETGEQLLQRILESRRSQWKSKGKYKEPAASATTDLPELPEGWVWASIERAVGRVTVGHVGSMKEEYVEQGVPFLRSQNVRENRYDPVGLKFISEEFHRRLAKSTLRPGDIVVVRSGSVGVSCVIPEHLGEANCSDLVIVKNPQAVLPDFGAYYMNSIVESRVAAGKVGVALIHFNTQSVAKLPLPVPPIAEQQRIVAEVDRRLSLIRETGTQIESDLLRAERFRQAILGSAFSGQMSIDDGRCNESGARYGLG